jgi:hypothetical protein
MKIADSALPAAAAGAFTLAWNAYAVLPSIELSSHPLQYATWALLQGVGGVGLLVFLVATATALPGLRLIAGGLVAILAGSWLWVSGPAISEAAAPGLTQIGQASWVEIGNYDSATRRPESFKNLNVRSAVVRLEDDRVLDVLSLTGRSHPRGTWVALHQDSGGAYWVGEVAERENLRTMAGSAIAFGVVASLVSLTWRFRRVRDWGTARLEEFLDEHGDDNPDDNGSGQFQQRHV